MEALNTEASQRKRNSASRPQFRNPACISSLLACATKFRLKKATSVRSWASCLLYGFCFMDSFYLFYGFWLASPTVMGYNSLQNVFLSSYLHLRVIMSHFYHKVMQVQLVEVKSNPFYFCTEQKHTHSDWLFNMYFSQINKSFQWSIWVILTATF